MPLQMPRSLGKIMWERGGGGGRETRTLRDSIALMDRWGGSKDEGLRSCTLDLEVNTAWLELVRTRNPDFPRDQVPSGCSLATVENLL